jgi:hypothetical protein
MQCRMLQSGGREARADTMDRSVNRFILRSLFRGPGRPLPTRAAAQATFASTKWSSSAAMVVTQARTRLIADGNA